MAKIVIGLGTSHSPLLSLDAHEWAERAKDDLRNQALNLSDGRILSYEALLAERGPKFADRSSQETFAAQVVLAQRALDRLAKELEEARPDVVLIIGDDHEELFGLANIPSIAVYYGDELVTLDMTAGAAPGWAEKQSWLAKAFRGCAMDSAYRFAGAKDFALALIDGLIREGVDVGGASGVDAPKHGIGHAFGFVIQRLFAGRSIPVVPILQNTYYPPNVIRPVRCLDIGRRLRKVIEAMPGQQRVAIVASGGLSHFVTDEDLDRKILEAFRRKDTAAFGRLPVSALKSGSSEILCWITAAGALEGLEHAWSDYVPVYRTPAGSGVGLGFLCERANGVA